MLGDITKAEEIYIVCGYSDMRKSIDGFATMIKGTFGMDPFAPCLFLFCGKRRDRLKALYWEGDGFVLLYKRLETGSFKWPKNTEAVRSITQQEFRWLLEGLCVDQPKALKKVNIDACI